MLCKDDQQNEGNDKQHQGNVNTTNDQRDRYNVVLTWHTYIIMWRDSVKTPFQSHLVLLRNPPHHLFVMDGVCWSSSSGFSNVPYVWTSWHVCPWSGQPHLIAMTFFDWGSFSEARNFADSLMQNMGKMAAQLHKSKSWTLKNSGKTCMEIITNAVTSKTMRIDIKSTMGKRTNSVVCCGHTSVFCLWSPASKGQWEITKRIGFWAIPQPSPLDNGKSQWQSNC